MSVYFVRSLQGNRKLALLLLLLILIWLFNESSHLLSDARKRQTRCTPKINLVFLKTHKTGSTSLQNILMRSGVKHGARFVLPPTSNILSTSRLFHVNQTWPFRRTRTSYNMLLHHTRLNYDVMKQLMPADTLFITILRDPTSAFESMYNYYHMENMYRVPLSNFKASSSIQNLKRRHLGHLGSNQMLYDMGFDPNDRDDARLEQFIKQIDHIFDLVLISERMDESLILLKDLLCWNLEDLVTFRLNARMSRSPIASGAKRMIASLNWADHLLYQHFSAKFDHLVDLFGKNYIRGQVKELQTRTEQLFSRCVSDTKVQPNGVMEYLLRDNSSQCWLMTRSELEFTSFIRSKQRVKDSLTDFNESKVG